MEERTRIKLNLDRVNDRREASGNWPWDTAVALLIIFWSKEERDEQATQQRAEQG